MLCLAERPRPVVNAEHLFEEFDRKTLRPWQQCRRDIGGQYLLELIFGPLILVSSGLIDQRDDADFGKPTDQKARLCRNMLLALRQLVRIISVDENAADFRQ